MQPGAGPLAHAAVDVLLQLLQYCQRGRLTQDIAPLLADMDGPVLLAAICRTALEQGTLNASAYLLRRSEVVCMARDAL